MHIKKVKIHRFKQFESTSIPLQECLTLLVGGNNSGKSSLLHALAVWEFCKTIVEFNRGRKAWTSGGLPQGIGISASDFTPIILPSLRHLWHNLNPQKKHEKDGYTLKIGTEWDTGGKSYKLEFGLSLANDRLFIKTTNSNLILEELQDDNGGPLHGIVPKIAYLPPFAGITDREPRHSVAMRNRLLGQGLSGAVIRNVLFDLADQNKKSRAILRGHKTKISSKDLASLREHDPWELLQKALSSMFGIGLKIHDFDDRYHAQLIVETHKAKLDAQGVPKKDGDDSPHDLMVEGSGFLQWLSVYALALSPEIDVVLLDEPDAHLHCSLQLELVRLLSSLSTQKDKQILMATHSTELIKSFDHRCILQICKKPKYLSEPERKVALLAGIGTHFSPKLHELGVHKRLLLVESEFDERMLKAWAVAIGLDWPANLCIWHWTGGHKERRQLFMQLKTEVPDLQAISIRDRDDEADETTQQSIIDKSYPPKGDGFKAYKWRRRHIENYLLHPTAIARAAGKTEDEVRAFFADKHGLALPPDIIKTDVVFSVRDARGKEIMTSGSNAIDVVFKLKRDDLAKAMFEDEIAEDVRTFLKALTHVCQV